jgi:transposase
MSRGFITEDNLVRIIDAFVEKLELDSLGFEGTTPATTGRPSYHPAVLLKIYIYGYLNRVQSSQRLERECLCNVEVMWLTGRLAPDFKTIAEFRNGNGEGIRNVYRRFVTLCRDLKPFTQAIVAIDSSKFKAVSSRDGTSRRTRSKDARSRSSKAFSGISMRFTHFMNTAQSCTVVSTVPIFFLCRWSPNAQ